MIVETLLHTPKWVFGLLILLIVLGVKQSKDRLINPFLILLLPIIMVCLSFFSLYSRFALSSLPIGVWFFTLVSIAYVMQAYFPVKGAYFDSTTRRIFIPGSWQPLILMMAIFLTKYMIGLMNALYSSLVVSTGFVVGVSLVYGALSGIFTARALNLWRIIRVVPVP